MPRNLEKTMDKDENKDIQPIDKKVRQYYQDT